MTDRNFPYFRLHHPRWSSLLTGRAPARHAVFHIAALFLALAFVNGCNHTDTAAREAREAPPANPVEVETGGSSLVQVDHPQRFPLVPASGQQMANTLQVTGTVEPDVSREIPVLSLANGRVVALNTGLGDYVHKGQLVMTVESPDVTTAFDAYLKAVNDEHLTNVTLVRDNLLFDKGAIAQSQLQAAQAGDDDARADLLAADQQLKILGVDKSHPSDIVKVYAPASGVIIAQNVTAAGAAGITFAGSAGSLTIADLSHIWVVCDVYENDLAQVHLGQHAAISLTAFPGKTFSGTISDIGAQLDPTLRTAKVRIQVQNPGFLLRIGMFATATLTTSRPQVVVAVPANAVLQLHDRSYVFVPSAAGGSFRRVQVTLGSALSNNYVEVKTGLQLGQQVVSNALDLQNTADQ
jgi:cobalt-zinc-cadmium efflux system membrane fusion protein